MEFLLILAGLIVLIWCMSRLGGWLYDSDNYYGDPIPWPRLMMAFQVEVMDEVAIMRENQKNAITAEKLAQRYAERMNREQEAGRRRMAAISQAYVRKAQEISRS